MNTSFCCSPSVLTSAALPQHPAGHTYQSYSPTTQKLVPATEQSHVPSRSTLDCVFEIRRVALLQSRAHMHSRKRKCSSVVNEEVEEQFTEKLRGLTKLPGHTMSHAKPLQPQPILSFNTPPEKETDHFSLKMSFFGPHAVPPLSFTWVDLLGWTNGVS